MNIIERFKSETPAIWRKVTWISTTVKGACVSLLGYNFVSPLPGNLTTYAGWILGACVVITAFAEAQVKK